MGKLKKKREKNLMGKRNVVSLVCEREIIGHFIKSSFTSFEHLFMKNFQN